MSSAQSDLQAQQQQQQQVQQQVQQQQQQVAVAQQQYALMQAQQVAQAQAQAVAAAAAAAQQQVAADLGDLTLSAPVAGAPAPSHIEIRCLLDNSAVGGIIGKGGMSVRQVREESAAFVSIVKADFRHVQERIMILKGSVEQVATAVKGIAMLLIDTASRREERPVETAQLRLLVHKSAVGAIIGKSGDTIKRVQAETGARVQVSNETLPSSSEKTVTLTGSAPQMYAAMLRVATQLLQNPLKVGTKVFPYVPGNQVFAPAYGGQVAFAPQSAQGMHMYHPNQAAAAAAGLQQTQFGGLIRAPAPTMMSTQKIAIPTICCGSIIGKGGNVIKELRLQSQTNISISDPDEATPNERVVTLSGSPQSISHAVFLIRQLVEAYQPNQQPQQQQAQQPNQQQQQQQPQPQQPAY